MNKVVAIAVVIGGLALMSCSDKSSEPEYEGTSNFPLTTDSRWEYTRDYYVIPFNDSALADTESYEIIRHVAGPDTVIDGNQLIAVDDSVARTDSIDANPYVDRHLYCITEGQLRDYGRITIFPSGDEVPAYFDPPHVILDLPLMANKGWTESTGDFVSITSAVLGIQYVDVAGAAIKCDVVRTRMIDLHTGHVYFDSYRWYSNSGLIRDETDFGTEILEDTSGVVIDSVRYLDVLELVDMEIQGG
jgi:hypothetical protein